MFSHHSMRYSVFGKEISDVMCPFQSILSGRTWCRCVMTSWVVFYFCRNKPLQTWHHKCPRSFWSWEVQAKYGWALCPGSHQARIKVSAKVHLIWSSSHQLIQLANAASWLSDHTVLLAGSWRHSQFLEPLCLPCGPFISKGSRRTALLYNPSHIFNLCLLDPDFKRLVRLGQAQSNYFLKVSWVTYCP